MRGFGGKRGYSGRGWGGCWTVARDTIMRIFEDTEEHLCAGDVIRELAQRGTPLPVPTVYRTLAWLEGAGFLRKEWVRGVQVYEWAGKPFHVHLLCKSCGQLVDVPVVEEVSEGWNALIGAVKHASGVEVHSGNLRLYGVCNNCKQGGV